MGEQKKTSVHVSAERVHMHGDGYSYIDYCMTIDGGLTADAIGHIRQKLNMEFEKEFPRRIWAGESKIMSITKLDY